MKLHARLAGVVALAALVIGAPVTTHAGNASSASITLEQTVMIDDGNDICGTETSIVVPAGTTVRFCYTVTNTGDVTLDSHTVSANVDGVVLSDFPYNLTPGASAHITSTEEINASITNDGTWIATNDANDMAQANSSVTVTVAGTQHSAEGSVSAVVTAQSACSLSITVTSFDEGDDTAAFTTSLTGRPADVSLPTFTAFIGFPEGGRAFENFTVAVGDSLNGDYTFTVTKTSGDGTAGITNPITVTVPVADLPICGQHSATVNIVSSSACDLDLNVLVDNGGDDDENTPSQFTVQSTGRPAGVDFADVTTYIGFSAGNFAFNNFDVGPGGSLNGTYYFTIDKTSGLAMDGIDDPIQVSIEVSGLPTCGARVIIEKVTEGGFGGPFEFEVREGDEGENLIASPTGSTSQDGVREEIYDAYLTPGFYSVSELFEVGDPSDTSTWDAGDGFFPGDMTCELLDTEGNPDGENTAEPQSNGVTGLGFNVDDGETMHCVVENLAPANITIQKNTPGEQDTPTFQFTGDLTEPLAGGQSTTYTGLEPGGYLITEQELEGWTLTSAGCEGGDSKFDLGSRTLYIFVEPGESATCEFVNFKDEVTPTTDDSGSGIPTTTIRRGLPQTGSNGSNAMVVWAFGLLAVGLTMLGVRRRATR